jgi:hypothetical protein
MKRHYDLEQIISSKRIHIMEGLCPRFSPAENHSLSGLRNPHHSTHGFEEISACIHVRAPASGILHTLLIHGQALQIGRPIPIRNS